MERVPIWATVAVAGTVVVGGLTYYLVPADPTTPGPAPSSEPSPEPSQEPPVPPSPPTTCDPPCVGHEVCMAGVCVVKPPTPPPPPVVCDPPCSGRDVCKDGVCVAPEPPSPPPPTPSNPPGGRRTPILREGAGANSQGGSGCPKGLCGDVYQVTTLADSGPGSLRLALEQRNKPRIVEFAVGGTITLTKRLDNWLPYLTVDCSTAPNPGITIYHPDLKTWQGFRPAVGTHDVIIHDCRIEGIMDPTLAKMPFVNNESMINDGDSGVFPVSWDDKPNTLPGNAEILLSHITGTHAYDDVGSFWCGCTNCSIAGSFFLENFHPFTTGCKMGYPSDSPLSRHFVSYVQTVCIANGERCPIIREGVFDWDVIGSITFDWKDYSSRAGQGPGGYGFQLATDFNPRGNVIGNAFLPGPWRQPYGCMWGQGPGGVGDDAPGVIRSRPLYYADNLFPLDAQGKKLNEFECRSNGPKVGDPPVTVPFKRNYPLTIIPSSQLEKVLDAAGVSRPTPAELAAKERARVALRARLAKGQGPQ